MNLARICRRSKRRPLAPAGCRVTRLLPLLTSLLLAVPAGPGLAQPRPDPASSAPPLDEISATDLANSARSTVRIIERENHRIEEHRVGNNVYMVKVKPRNAPPYYLIDEDGSGDLQWRRGTGLERTQVPHWAILRW